MLYIYIWPISRREIPSLLSPQKRSSSPFFQSKTKLKLAQAIFGLLRALAHGRLDLARTRPLRGSRHRPPTTVLDCASSSSRRRRQPTTHASRNHWSYYMLFHTRAWNRSWFGWSVGELQLWLQARADRPAEHGCASRTKTVFGAWSWPCRCRHGPNPSTSS